MQHHENQTTIQQDQLWNEVLTFANNADALLTIDLLTHLMVENLKRDGCPDANDFNCFYCSIRLLTHIARHGKTLHV